MHGKRMSTGGIRRRAGGMAAPLRYRAGKLSSACSFYLCRVF